MTSKKLNIKTYITINMTLNPKKLAYYEKKYERNPLEDTLKFMSNKWTLHVLRDLFLGKSHFNEFKVNRPSLDNKALSRCLKTMQDNGLIYKTNERYSMNCYCLLLKRMSTTNIIRNMKKKN